VEKCLHILKNLRLPRGRKVAIDELEGKFRDALNKCQKCYESAKDIRPGSIERRIICKYWRDAQVIYKRIQFLIDLDNVKSYVLTYEDDIVNPFVCPNCNVPIGVSPNVYGIEEPEDGLTWNCKCSECDHMWRLVIKPGKQNGY